MANFGIDLKVKGTIEEAVAELKANNPNYESV